MWYRDGRKMATGQYRSAFSFDDVAQKTILAGSTLQINSQRTSKPLEEQCGEFAPLVSLRFRGVKTIDVIERNRLPKNSVAFESGDLEVDFVCVFPTLLRAISPFFFWEGGTFGCIPINWYAGSEAQRYTNIMLRKYTHSLVHLYTSKLAHRYICIQLHG